MRGAIGIILGYPLRFTTYARKSCYASSCRNLYTLEHLTGDQKVTGSILVRDSESFSE